jgi:hypothetical protein
VTNEATASAQQADGDVVRSKAATETTPVRVVRAVGLVQKPTPIEDVNGSGRDDAGDRIGFGFTVVNTGTVSLTEVTIRDPLLDDAGVAISCPVSDLSPGQKLTCTSDPYVITEGDVRSGSVVSVATASALTPTGPLTSAASSIGVSLDESQAPTPDPTVPTPGTAPPPPPGGSRPGGSLPTQAPKTLSLWIPALALLLVVPEAVLLIWQYRRNRLAAAAATARRQKPPEISIWMGR